MVKIPQDKTELIKDLRWNFDDASYKAPEESLQWQRTQSTLIKHLSKPTEDWEFEILSIFTTQSVDDLKIAVTDSLNKPQKQPYDGSANNNFIWNDDKVIDFVNWYIKLHKLDFRYTLENKLILNSFKNGDDVSKWHSN